MSTVDPFAQLAKSYSAIFSNLQIDSSAGNMSNRMVFELKARGPVGLPRCRPFSFLLSNCKLTHLPAAPVPPLTHQFYPEGGRFFGTSKYPSASLETRAVETLFFTFATPRMGETKDFKCADSGTFDPLLGNCICPTDKYMTPADKARLSPPDMHVAPRLVASARARRVSDRVPPRHGRSPVTVSPRSTSPTPSCGTVRSASPAERVRGTTSCIRSYVRPAGDSRHVCCFAAQRGGRTAHSLMAVVSLCSQGNYWRAAYVNESQDTPIQSAVLYDCRAGVCSGQVGTER